MSITNGSVNRLDENDSAQRGFKVSRFSKSSVRQVKKNGRNRMERALLNGKRVNGHQHQTNGGNDHTVLGRRAETVSNPPINGKGGVMHQNDVPIFARSFSSYSNGELRALRFASIRQFNRAIDIIYEDSRFRNLPFFTPNGLTLFVPADAVRLFRLVKLNFSISKLLDQDDVSSSRLGQMRWKHAL